MEKGRRRGYVRLSAERFTVSLSYRKQRGQIDTMNREWTADDDALVREFAPKISLQRLAVRMKRSESSIKSRARSLGVETTKVVRLTREQRTGF